MGLIQVITFDFKTVTGEVYPGGVLYIKMLTDVAIAAPDIHPVMEEKFVAGDEGIGTAAVAVPPTGAFQFRFRLPNWKDHVANVGYNGGEPLALSTILAESYVPPDEAVLEGYLRRDGSNAKTGVYPQWRFSVQPQAINADEIIVIPSDHQMVVFGGLAIEPGGQLIIEAGGVKITPPL